MWIGTEGRRKRQSGALYVIGYGNRTFTTRGKDQNDYFNAVSVGRHEMSLKPSVYDFCTLGVRFL